jgi:predicted phage tail protein
MITTNQIINIGGENMNKFLVMIGIFLVSIILGAAIFKDENNESSWFAAWVFALGVSLIYGGVFF